ncbi:DUF5671 domain-containing protein [Mycetocola zhadangensis]|uniref:DUF5671 domain-containing protein n=1 Tax=Mycetocola zhadangensis TaxID=1164595 RepID=UPI0019CC97D6|nr:DUF5671 domain-containing protein [Mycetocola zhadangensis]GGF03178.1 hypothetical protein GCM10011313_27880 [Mycetocola zhadangensis]
MSGTFSQAKPSPAGSIVRRLVVYTLLAVLVCIAASGLAGLLGLLLDVETVLAGTRTSSTAQFLTFTLIGVPFAAALWWTVWRRLSDPAERNSLAWGLYLSAVLTLSLIVFSTALLGVLAGLIEGDWDGPGLATALVWAAVWAWHCLIWRNPLTAPGRLTVVPAVLGASFGLILGAGSAWRTLASVFDAGLDSLDVEVLVESSWGIGALQSLLWAIGGAAIWAWHWYRAGARLSTTALSNVALVVLGILGASIVTLAGIGTSLFVLLRLGFDRTDPVPVLLSPMPAALAATLVGCGIWIYSHATAEQRSPATREAGVLATSGVALAGAASGIGVIVNATLGIIPTPLAGDDTRTLLLGGLSALLVGAPVWWFAWRPLTVTDASRQFAGRRIYLIAIFGISAVVALITLLVIGFRLFEFFLGGSEGLVDRIRAPLGLLTATALVAGYHFSVWRRDRDEADRNTPPERARTIGDVVLVTGADADPLVRAIETATGASVTVWRSASSPYETNPADLVRALDGITGARVLIVATDRVEVIPLHE